MGEIVNLKAVRKAKARAEDKAKGAVNRAAFGRSKASRAADAKAEAARNRTLDQSRRDP